MLTLYIKRSFSISVFVLLLIGLSSQQSYTLTDEYAFQEGAYRIHYARGQDASFYIDTIMGDWIKQKLYYEGGWECHIADLIKKYAKPGSTVLDAGAHIGVHTITMSRAVGDSGKVHAFEPQRKLNKENEMNLKLNGCYHNVVLYRKALGSKFGNVTMSIPPSWNPGGTSIGSGGESTEMITIDSLGLENLSLIKMDVEGYEYEALLGGEETIRKWRPVIIIEIWQNRDLVAKQKTERILKNFGYDLVHISNDDFIAFPVLPSAA